MKIIWKKITVVIVFISVISISRAALLANKVHKIPELYTNPVALENIYYLIQIICGFFVMFGVFIAVWQYVLSVKDSKNNKEREYQLHQKEVTEMEKDRIQRAIDLAGYYKDNVLEDYIILKSVYSNMGVLDILNKISFNGIKYFDKKELDNSISNDDIKKIKSVAIDPKLVEILTIVSESCGTWSDCKEVITIEKDDKISKQVKVSAAAITNSYKGMQRRVLNNLEYFAMHFTHGTADESVVYQSLHTTYLEIVETLYYDIASNNEGSEKKLFTNVVDLYNIWNEEARKQNENEVAASRDHVSKGKILKNY